jgi:hypothetical protein
MSVMSGDALRTVTPICRTSAGSTGSARATRFCTWTWAVSRLVPRAKVTVSRIVPSLLDVLDMYSMCSTPLICSSIGVATVSATVRELAPG